MRNDARPIGEEFRDIAEHSDQPSEKNREPAEGVRPAPPREPLVISRDPADQIPPDSSER